MNFSSEPALHLLLVAGVKKINLLGIDGGQAYSKQFEHLTPLTNGVKSFDVQFEVIRALAKKYKAQVQHPFMEI